ncbi:hypothetical protein FS749_002684, partial [Ceratobasidium sp. UAMH 11750]
FEQLEILASLFPMNLQPNSKFCISRSSGFLYVYRGDRNGQRERTLTKFLVGYISGKPMKMSFTNRQRC